MKAALFLLSLLNPLAQAGDYCVAVRGNGEYAPGHWGGLAKVVEQQSLPSAMIGGSSASLTIFLINGIARSPALQNLPEEEKKKRAALLIKSLPAFLQRMGERDGVLSLYAAMSGVQSKLDFNKDFISSVRALTAESYKAMEAAEQNPGAPVANGTHFLTKYLPILNPELRAGLSNPLTFTEAKKRLMESAAVFGAYKVDGDPSMFFRSGLVDFKYIALLSGTIADFYSGHGGEDVNQRLSEFADKCADSQLGKDWQGGACAKAFENAADSYLQGKSDIRDFPNKAIFESVGEAKGVESFISTATMQGGSMDRFKKLNAEYRKLDPARVGAEHAAFSVNYEKDLRFSYIGSPRSLSKIQGNLSRLYREDEKSKKFHSLGDQSWITAIAASAGEPGLTNFQPLLQLPTGNPEAARKLVFSELRKSPRERWRELQKDSSAKVYNMGGWSDLHPTLALRSHPACAEKQIVYLNRQGGETCFGQTLFVRSTGAQGQVPFYSELCDKQKGNAYDWRQDPRFANARNSPWERLYHSGNSRSSYNLSVHEADVILCSNWDSLPSPFSGQQGASIWDHFRHAYHSPLVSKAERLSGAETRPGCSSPLDRQ